MKFYVISFSTSYFAQNIFVANESTCPENSFSHYLVSTSLWNFSFSFNYSFELCANFTKNKTEKENFECTIRIQYSSFLWFIYYENNASFHSITLLKGKTNVKYSGWYVWCMSTWMYVSIKYLLLGQDNWNIYYNTILFFLNNV